jgi:activator of Hsp90 ATPase-like protein
VIEPIRIELEVRGPARHAFDVWTNRISTWWPVDHTVSGEPGLTVVLEGRPGGRIFERTHDGTEHDWGEVTVWEPPSRLIYLWHLRRDRADATLVAIRFTDRDDATTLVEIEHRGWEVLGAGGQDMRDRNRGGWATLLPHFEAAAARDRRTPAC